MSLFEKNLKGEVREGKRKPQTRLEPEELAEGKEQ